MTADNNPLAFPPIVRPEGSLAPESLHFPTVRFPNDVRLSTVALASGLLLALEGVRLMARTSRKRSRARVLADASTELRVTYEWTQVVYERHEHR